MRFVSALRILAAVGSVTASDLRPRNYETHDYYAVHVDPSLSPEEVARSLGVDYEGQLGELADHHIFSTPQLNSASVDDALVDLKRRRQKRDYVGEEDIASRILFSQKQKVKPRMEKRGAIPVDLSEKNAPALSPRQALADENNDELNARQEQIVVDLEINDPIFREQWHLFNVVQKGHDVNVSDVWRQGVTGKGSTVAIVDDGLDMYSDDLKDNYFAEGSWDFNDHTAEPKPRLSDDRHGTRCAGEIAAVRNDVCGVGVAYDSKVAGMELNLTTESSRLTVVGIRILSKIISDADEAVAMNYAFQKNQIYSCSWGPPDDGQAMDAPGLLIKRAMLNGVQNGRDGKGSVFVFASGNGAKSEDNCNFDGYTNSIYSITVGAIDRKGQHPYYSELCSASMVVTYSSGSGDAIVSCHMRLWISTI
jgi:kexin